MDKNLTFGTTIVSGIDAIFNFSNRAETHKAITAEYLKLTNDIVAQLNMFDYNQHNRKELNVIYEKAQSEITNLNEVLPFPDNSFDIVVMAEVLEHLPYPMITLGEVKRVLKQDGEFIGNLPLAYHLKDRIQILRGRRLVISGDPTHLQFLSYEDVKELLSVFFEIKKIEILKGGKKKSKMFPTLFARNIAFNCASKV